MSTALRPEREGGRLRRGPSSREFGRRHLSRARRPHRSGPSRTAARSQGASAAGAPVTPRLASGLDPARVRHAAALLLLFPVAGLATIPLTIRSESRLDRHGGQVSLPGGVVDPGETFEQAALREAHEEVGLGLDDIRICGALTPLDIPVSGFRLHPIVAATFEPTTLTPSDGEVAQTNPRGGGCSLARPCRRHPRRHRPAAAQPEPDPRGHPHLPRRARPERPRPLGRRPPTPTSR